MITTYLMISLSISIVDYFLQIMGGIKVSCPKSVKYSACLLKRQKRKENTVPGRHTSETMALLSPEF